jgi:hypothetical protein
MGRLVGWTSESWSRWPSARRLPLPTGGASVSTSGAGRCPARLGGSLLWAGPITDRAVRTGLLPTSMRSAGSLVPVYGPRVYYGLRRITTAATVRHATTEPWW